MQNGDWGSPEVDCDGDTFGDQERCDDGTVFVTLRIAQLTAPFERVPPLGYGGTEQVVSSLVDRLTEAGHDVTLYATTDSVTKARLLGAFDAPVDRYDWFPELLHSLDPFLAADDFDVIHNHSRAGFLLAPFVRTPTVHTLHGHMESRQMSRTYRRLPELSYVSISRSQQRIIPELNYVANIYNGIDTDAFVPSGTSGSYLLSIGAIAPRKGVHTAVRVAKATGIPLRIAGRVTGSGTAYFREVIEPHIDGQHITFVGEVGGREKIELFQNALALLFPIEWEEPFGLVMAEAMACGRPVIGFRRGSVPEVIKDGETGFVVDTLEEMIGRVDAIGELSSRRCRAHAVENFGIERMVKNYELLYREFTDAASRAGGTPV